MKIFTTPDRIRFGIAGSVKPEPAPTLLTFASSMEQALSRTQWYNKTGRSLTSKGFLVISLDLPAHGEDVLPGEVGTMETGLADWRRRIEGGSNIVADFTSKVSSVIDFVIDSGWTDPRKIATCGTSRGGFMALHAAAADDRIKCAAGLAPVTDLAALREFAGLEEDETVRGLRLHNCAVKLAGKWIWISIGNRDTRVSTELAIDLAKDIVGESVAQGMRPMVELHVTANEGHGVHPTARRDAAKWIAQAMEVE